MSKKIDLSLIENYIMKILRSKLSDITSRTSGDYIARVTDLVSTRKLISEMVVACILDFGMICFSIILLVQMEKSLFLLSTGGIMLYIVVMYILNRKYKDVNYEMMRINAEVQSCLKELLQGIEIIKLYNLADFTVKKFMKKYLRFEKSIFKGNILGVISGSSSAFIEQICNVIVIFGGFILIENNQTSLGELLSFYMILSCLINPVKDLLALQPTLHSGLIAIDRIEDIQYMENEDIGEKARMDVLDSIILENVGFYYPEKQYLFQHISFEIVGIKKIAIIGKNGCGKSTLMRLIMGVEHTIEGKILYNGTSIDNIHLHDIRKMTSYVVQNNFIFADTIYGNLTLGDDTIEIEEIRNISEAIGLNEFISDMPMGYETYINENGDNLSLGQRQIIALARALLRKPKLLILDEATSNLDCERAKKVINYVLKLPIPCIIITHSRELIDKVDEVIEL